MSLGISKGTIEARGRRLPEGQHAKHGADYSDYERVTVAPGPPDLALSHS